MQDLAGTTHHMVGETHEMAAITYELRDHIADFEDFWRPIRSYFYWDKHCSGIPICYSLRSIFDSIDGVDDVSDKLGDLVKDLDKIDMLMPQLLAQFPEMIQIMQGMQTMLLTMHSSMSGIFSQMDESSNDPTAMGKAFDNAKNDDSFYAPSGGLQKPRLQTGAENIPVAGRKGRPDVHHAKRRSRDAPGHRAGRADKNGGRGSAQGNAARKRQDLPHRYLGDGEGHGATGPNGIS